MKKGIRMLLLNTFMLISVLFLVSCQGNKSTGSETPDAQNRDIETSSSGDLYNKEMFAVEDEGILFRLGMTISEVEAQGVEVSDKEALELENVLVFFDNAEKIDDLTAYEGVKMSGKLNFSSTRDDVISIFNIDEDREYIGNDPNTVSIFFNDKNSDQFERVIISKESASQFSPDDFIVLEIEFYEESEMFRFNLYYPE